MKAYFTTLKVRKTGTLPGDNESYVATASIYDAQVYQKTEEIVFQNSFERLLR
jgi:hypothetical protein